MSTRKIKNNNNDNSNTVDSKKTVKQVKVTGVRHEYKGIIPPPSIIDGYEKNCPGATDRILAMTENQLKSTRTSCTSFLGKNLTQDRIAHFFLLFASFSHLLGL